MEVLDCKELSAASVGCVEGDEMVGRTKGE